MTTIKEVARAAKASVTAVSLSLNHREAGHVKREQADQIREIARKMGYSPNPLARSLRTSHTHSIGFVSEEIATTPYAGEIVLGAQDAASELGYMMLLVNTDGEAREKDEIAGLKRYGVDGFLYAKMYDREVTLPPSLKNQPTVTVDATDPTGKVPSIAPDEFSIGYDAATRLIHAGCRRIAYVGCSEPLLAEPLRRAGYEKALQDAGITPDPSLEVAIGNNDDGSAPRIVSDLFDAVHPDGFFCFNDARTWYVYDCASRRGLKVGEDISVIGVDYHRLVAETFYPKLTTIALPHYEMGYWSARRLIMRIEGHEPAEPEHTLRQSKPRTVMPPLDGPTNAVRIHCTLIERDSVAQSKS